MTWYEWPKDKESLKAQKRHHDELVKYALENMDEEDKKRCDEIADKFIKQIFRDMDK